MNFIIQSKKRFTHSKEFPQYIFKLYYSGDNINKFISINSESFFIPLEIE